MNSSAPAVPCKSVLFRVNPVLKQLGSARQWSAAISNFEDISSKHESIIADSEDKNTIYEARHSPDSIDLRHRKARTGFRMRAWRGVEVVRKKRLWHGGSKTRFVSGALNSALKAGSDRSWLGSSR